MRALLISANTEKIPDPVYPIGAACVGAAARRAGHDVEAVDLCFADDARALVTSAIRDFAPDVVGISLRNLDTSAYPQNTSYIDDYRSLVSWVRDDAAARAVVLGGAGFTVMPTTILEELHADYGVVGEGELAFPWLLGGSSVAARFAAAPDVHAANRVNGGVLVTPTPRIRQLDAARRCPIASASTCRATTSAAAH